MNRIARTAALGGLLAGLALAAGAAQAAETSAGERLFDATTLSLSAQGQVQAAPDKASITLGVQAHGATAGEAMRDDAAQMNAVLGALRKARIADKDIQTSNLNLGAEYAYEPNKPPRLTGYQASNEVTVTVNDLARLGPTVDAVVGAGANQINGVSFGLKNPKAAEDAARKAAVAALRDKAELYAAATGYRVSRLVNLSEGGGYAPSPVRPLMLAKAMAGAETPVASGELTVRVDISATYELAK
ncbi:MAG: SIMPL domain-containing protein [Caulobacteraceae bacterium]|nr:SIMPL domain-containing protein [Caulobacteraceae bacterium]